MIVASRTLQLSRVAALPATRIAVMPAFPRSFYFAVNFTGRRAAHATLQEIVRDIILRQRFLRFPNSFTLCASVRKNAQDNGIAGCMMDTGTRNSWINKKKKRSL